MTNTGNSTIYYHDGAKLLGETLSNGAYALKYIYNSEGIMGFELSLMGGSWTSYYYLKDAMNSVIAILDSNGNEAVLYDYDTWGKCTIKDDNTRYAGEINPIRWKSQYYDNESGLYYINGRYYSPIMKQYISSLSPEVTMANANIIYGINMYLLTVDNPVHMVYNGYNIASYTYLTWDPPNLSGWDIFWRSSFGNNIATILLIVAGTLLFNVGGWTLVLGTFSVIGSAIALNAAIAGFQSKNQGKGFFNGFVNYINNEWSQAVAIEAIVIIAALGVGEIVHSVANAFSKGAGNAGQGFDTFKAAKKHLGSPGEGKQWHHIVEQSQIKKSGFNPTQIHNTNNLIAVDKATHAKISGYYNTTTFDYTNGMSVRNWLAGQSYQSQYDFGINVLRNFGVIG